MSVQLWNFNDGGFYLRFFPRINILKSFFLNNPTMNYGSSKSAKSYFQSQFSMSKTDGFFSKKKTFKNINLGDHFL